MEKLNNVSIVNKTVGKEVSFYYEAISNNKIKYIKVSLDFLTDLDYNMDNPQTYEFSGKRIKRGLYQTKDNYRFNADCNGALNILRKSSVVDLSVLYGRGELDTPKRIRIA